MRSIEPSGGQVLLGLAAIALGGLAGLLTEANLTYGFDLEVVLLAVFTVVLVVGGVHTVGVGSRGAPLPGDPAWERDERGRDPFSGLLRITVIAVVAAPVVLFFGVPTMCGCIPDKAYYSASKSDLRNLQSAQESHHAEHGAYAGDLATLELVESDGVHVTMTGLGADGWGATATHEGLDDVTCAVYVGEGYRVAPATIQGVVTCN